MRSSQITVNAKKQSYPIRGTFISQLSNIVYIMTYNICNIHCVGRTSNSINTKCIGHEGSIKNEKDHQIAINCITYNHTLDDYNISIQDKETDKNKTLRLE